MRGFIPVFMERLRRSAEGGAEGPGAASRLGHTQNEATDLPANEEPLPQTRQDRGAVHFSAANSTALTKGPCFGSTASVSAQASRASSPSGRRPSRLAPGTSLSTRSRRRCGARMRKSPGRLGRTGAWEAVQEAQTLASVYDRNITMKAATPPARVRASRSWLRRAPWRTPLRCSLAALPSRGARARWKGPGP